jgi:transcriptional regulator with XRE-family HTH domain
LPRPEKLSDETLRRCLEQGLSQEEIAQRAGIAQSSVSKRIARLEPRAIARNLTRVEEAFASLWDTRKAAEENYTRAVKNYKVCDDKTRAIAEIRNHIKLGIDVMSLLYSIEELRAFQEEVLTILDECEPGTRDRILARLRERRTLRAAFEGGR